MSRRIGVTLDDVLSEKLQKLAASEFMPLSTYITWYLRKQLLNLATPKIEATPPKPPEPPKPAEPKAKSYAEVMKIFEDANKNKPRLPESETPPASTLEAPPALKLDSKPTSTQPKPVLLPELVTDIGDVELDLRKKVSTIADTMFRNKTRKHTWRQTAARSMPGTQFFDAGMIKSYDQYTRRGFVTVGARDYEFDCEVYNVNFDAGMDNNLEPGEQVGVVVHTDSSVILSVCPI